EIAQLLPPIWHPGGSRCCERRRAFLRNQGRDWRAPPNRRIERLRLLASVVNGRCHRIGTDHPCNRWRHWLSGGSRYTRQRIEKWFSVEPISTAHCERAEKSQAFQRALVG